MAFTQTPGIYPHLLRFWGRDKKRMAAARSLVPNDEDAYAVWFDTPAEVKAFKATRARDWTVCFADPDPAKGDIHQQTIAVVTLRFQGQTYTYRDAFGYGYPWDGVEYLYEDGNYACDCNRVLLLESRAGVQIDHHGFCGDRIELVTLAPLSEANRRVFGASVKMEDADGL